MATVGRGFDVANELEKAAPLLEPLPSAAWSQRRPPSPNDEAARRLPPPASGDAVDAVRLEAHRIAPM